MAGSTSKMLDRMGCPRPAQAMTLGGTEEARLGSPQLTMKPTPAPAPDMENVLTQMLGASVTGTPSPMVD